MPGRVIIQTYAADHYAVRAAAALDVDGFADEELLRRRLLGYPPASVLARLLIADPDRERAESRGPRGRRGGRACPASRCTGRCRRTSPAAPGAGGSRSSCGPRTRRARPRRWSACRPGVAIDVDPESLLWSHRYNARAWSSARILTAEEPILRERAKKVTAVRRLAPSAARRHARDDARCARASAWPPTRSGCRCRSR